MSPTGTAVLNARKGKAGSKSVAAECQISTPLILGHFLNHFIHLPSLPLKSVLILSLHSLLGLPISPNANGCATEFLLQFLVLVPTHPNS